MARVEELLSVQELINYTKTRKLKETMGDLLFPTQKIWEIYYFQLKR